MHGVSICRAFHGSDCSDFALYASAGSNLDTALKRCAFGLALRSITAAGRVMWRVGQYIWRLASWAFLCADLGDALVPFYFDSRWGGVCQGQSGTEEYGGDSGGLHSCFRYLQVESSEIRISKGHG